MLQTIYFSYIYDVHRDLHSFPTRRSSDLCASVISTGGAPRASTVPLIETAPVESEETSWMRQWNAGSPSASLDRKSTRLNSSHVKISYAVFCLKKKKTRKTINNTPQAIAA